MSYAIHQSLGARAVILSVVAFLVLEDEPEARAQGPVQKHYVTASTVDTASVLPPRPILIKGSQEGPPPYDRFGQAAAPEGFCCSSPRPGTAMLEIVALEVMPNYFNRNVFDDTTAVLSLKSWKHNMAVGLDWDDNLFSMNMFFHPYHGNLFFNTGRSNGYNFWASALFAAGGSFLWEMYGENNPGAINDWINTSIGGIMMGETLHRTAIMLRDNQATGLKRTLRELGGLFVDPMGGFNRLIRGEAMKIGDNPTDRHPRSSMVQVATGLQTYQTAYPSGQSDGPSDELDGGALYPYGLLTVQYGDWFDDYVSPYSSFQLVTQINFGQKNPIGEVSTDATLWGTTLGEDSKSRHTITANQRFVYVENPAVKFGGPFFGGTLNSHFQISDAYRLDTRIEPMFALMTGVGRAYEGPSGRPYDFGSGLATNVNATLFVYDFPVLRLAYQGVYTATLNGEKGHHKIHSPSVQFRLNLFRDVGVGFDYVLWINNGRYDNPRLQYESSRVSTIRVNVILSILDSLNW